MTESTQPAPQSDPQHHDGITEEDNKLPRWWLATLFVAMAFAYVYWQYFHVLRAGHGVYEEWAEEQVEAAKAQKLREERAPVTDELLVKLSLGPSAMAGEATFKTTCVACHGDHAEGKIGPNLTDNFWIHGGRPTDIYNTVTNGWPLKGMPAWKTSLGPTKIKEVVAYVLTLRGTNVPGKAPQGDAYPLDAGPAPAPALPARGAPPPKSTSHAGEAIPTIH